MSWELGVRDEELGVRSWKGLKDFRVFKVLSVFMGVGSEGLG